MTKCKFKLQPVWHETEVVMDGRTVLVSERPACLLLRLKGTRQTLMLPWNVAYVRAAFLYSENARATKKKRRRAVQRGVLAR